MNEDGDLVQMARTMIKSYGADALATVERRIEGYSRAGDGDRTVFWRGVAEGVREIDGGSL
jgi:hypothetical protein